MSAGTERVELAEVEPLADALVMLLAPYCKIALLAGSIRRRRPTVGDIEIVALADIDARPEEGYQPDLFGATRPRLTMVNRLHVALDALTDPRSPIEPVHWEPPQANGLHLWLERGDGWGQRWRKLRVDYYGRPGSHPAWPLALDVFMTEVPGAFGWIQVLRTGSGDFNRWLLERLRSAGVTSDKGRLHRGSQTIETPTEQAVFNLIGSPVIDPFDRSNFDDARPSERWERLSRGKT